MHRGGGTTAGRVVDTEGWARSALILMRALPGAHRVGLALTEGGGRRLRFTASDRGGSPDWCHVDAYDDVPLNTAVRTGQPVLGSLDSLAGRYPDFIARQRHTTTSALAAVPVVAAGQTLGGFVLFFSDPQPLDRRQRSELVALGARLGAGLRHAQRRDARPGIPLADEPVPADARVAVHDVPPDPAAVGDARRFLRSTLADWDVDEDMIADAVLCLCELVTNAVIHTHADAEVRVLLDDGVLTTTVRDAGAGALAPGAADDDPLRVHGRGLQVVASLASRWGSRLDAVGTTVWFALEG